MTATAQDIGTDQEYFEGDSLEVVVTVYKDGQIEPLVGASVEWKVKSGASQTKFSDSDSGITANVSNPSDGKITIKVDEGVTDGDAGTYKHYVRVTDSDGDKAIVSQGEFHITEW